MKLSECTNMGIAHACNCIGPQDGAPCCPCAMRDVVVKDGRYVRIQDLGPAAGDAALDRIHPPGNKTLRERLTVEND